MVFTVDRKIVPFALSVVMVYFATQWELGTARVMLAPSVVNCSIYNASIPCLPGDRNVFCLTNGTSLNGICEAQEAVCLENATISDSLAPCQQVITTQDPNGAMTTLNKASVSYILLLVTSSLFAPVVCNWR